jgi:restriction system protein
VDFEGLKENVSRPEFVAGNLASQEPPPKWEEWLPPRPEGFSKIRPGWKGKYESAVAEAKTGFEAAVEAHQRREEERLKKLIAAELRHAALVKGAEISAAQQHQEIDDLKKRFEQADSQAIVTYFSMVLQRSDYPSDFPRSFKMAFVPESRQLVVDYEFPTYESVPEARSHRYVKTRDVIEQVARPQTERRALYATLVAEIALRTVHELFEADRTGKFETVVFSGYVSVLDKATGKPAKPYLVTLRTNRDAFSELNLGAVDPQACLRALNASVSKSPSELAPVRPVLEFNMVDSRFIEETDVLSTLDQRPNLMELSPSEFENLITNLFEKMGLETRLTQASRDGGVDCVAYDPRPIFGGKVVIQAKRYKNTVGVSAVRDLFGTMQNEGATKGILVTTSGYGKAAFQFADGKPLELLSGTNLLYLLAEHAGMEAKIEVPDDWTDPSSEMTEEGPPIPSPNAALASSLTIGREADSDQGEGEKGSGPE